MSYDLERAMSGVIKEHLPSQVADELKTFFDEHKRLETDKRNLELQIQGARDENTGLKKKLLDEKVLVELEASIVNRENLVADREKEVGQREMFQANCDTLAQLAATQRYADSITDFMLNLSKNTTVRKSFSGSVLGRETNYSDSNGNNSWSNDKSVPVSHTETTTDVDESTEENTD